MEVAAVADVTPVLGINEMSMATTPAMTARERQRCRWRVASVRMALDTADMDPRLPRIGDTDRTLQRRNVVPGRHLLGLGITFHGDGG